MSPEKINLIPDGLEQQCTARRIAGQWLVVSAGLVLTIAVAAVWLGIELRQKAAQVAEHRERHRTTMVVRDHVGRLDQEISALRGQQQRYADLDISHSPLDDLKLIASVMKECNGSLVLGAFSFQTVDADVSKPSGTQPAGQRKTERKRFSHLSLTGTSDHDDTVAEFVDRLEQSGLFLAVDLKSTSAGSADEASPRQFVIETRAMGRGSK